MKYIVCFILNFIYLIGVFDGFTIMSSFLQNLFTLKLVFYAPTVGLRSCLLQTNVLEQLITQRPSIAELVCIKLRCFGVVGLRAVSLILVIMETCISISMPPEEGKEQYLFAGQVIRNFECIIQH